MNSKHQGQYDAATSEKVQSEVFQAMSEKVQEINTDAHSEQTKGVTCNIRSGSQYIICPETLQTFKSEGLAILEDLLSDKEMADLEIKYNKHMTGIIDDLHTK